MQVQECMKQLEKIEETLNTSIPDCTNLLTNVAKHLGEVRSELHKVNSPSVPATDNSQEQIFSHSSSVDSENNNVDLSTSQSQASLRPVSVVSGDGSENALTNNANYLKNATNYAEYLQMFLKLISTE